MILGVAIAFGLLYVLRSAVFPFICGLVLAYLLLPIISWPERRLPGQGRWLQMKRVSLIILVYIFILGLVGLLSFYIIVALVDAFLTLINNAPQYISDGLRTLEEWAETFRQWFPVEMQEQIGKLVQDAGVALGNAVRDAFIRGVSFTPATSSLIFGFVCLPIFLFYLLRDSEKLSTGFYSALSPRVAEHTKNIMSIIRGVFGRFVRAQLVLGSIVACLCFVGLLILGIDFSLALGLAVFTGAADLIPVLGPWIGGVAAVVVALAIAPEKAIWVALVYLLVQGMENIFLRPRIQGAYLRIHPAIVLVLLVLGAYVAGFWGLILVVPLAATIAEIYGYVRQRVRAEGVQQLAQP